MMDIAIYKLNYGNANYFKYIARLKLGSKEIEWRCDRNDLQELRDALLETLPLSVEELADREVSELMVLKKTENG